ncbi:MAG: hypothetical protein ACF8Q5_07160 [Phycisphaerales bacterium JB040]
MESTRRVWLVLLVAVAGAWSVSLVAGGAWLMGWDGLLAGGEEPAPVRLGRRSVGALGVAGGQLVFLCLVADRVFPGASRRLRWCLELLLCGGVLGALLGVVAGVVWWGLG